MHSPIIFNAEIEDLLKDLIRNALAAESMGVLQFFRGNLWSNSCLIWEASQSWETVRSWKVQRDVAAPQWRGFQSRRLQIRPDSLVPYRDRRVQREFLKLKKVQSV